MKKRIVTGRVSSIKDPGFAGRILVSLKEMDGNDYPIWVSPSLTPGWIAMPDEGETIDVEIPEDEDIVEFPEEVRYRGRVFDGENPVPELFRKNYPKRRGYVTPGGHFLMFDDTQGEEEITIAHKGKLLVSLTKDGIFLGSQSANQRVALGDLLMSTLSSILGTLIAHTHTGGTLLGGFTGSPIPTDQLAWTGDKTTVDNGSLLSDFVKTQKTKPT